MRILDILGESARTDQHNKANKLRELYKQRDEFTTKLNRSVEAGTDNKSLRSRLDDVKRKIKQMEEGSLTEGQLSDNIARGLINGDLDIYDVMNHPKNPAEREASLILQDMYDVVAGENGFAPDDDFEKIHDVMYDQIAMDYGSGEELNVTESIDHREMLRGLQQALTKAQSDLDETEDDFRLMKNTARTEREFDAVDDFKVTVEKKRALVQRLKKRVNLRKAALGGKA